MNLFKKMITAAAAAAVLCGMPVYAEDPPDYLALGDSISAGYGLAVPETDGFVPLLADAAGYDLINHAVTGNTASGIYAQISDGALDAAIQEAELITITCGGNDMMALLYGKTAELYNATGREPITPEEVLPILADTLDRRWFYVLQAAQTALDGFAESEEFTAGLAVYEENLTKVIGYITALNPEAEIIVATQYNPYRSFAGHASFSIVDTSMDAGAVKLNAVIRENAALGYTVAEVYDAFAAAEEDLCNATTSPINLDFHPNAQGHLRIVSVMLETLGVPCGHAAASGSGDFCVICGAAMLPAETTTEVTTTTEATTTTEVTTTTEAATTTEVTTTTETTTTTEASTTTETTTETTTTEATTTSEASGMLPETGYSRGYGFLVAAAAGMTILGGCALTASRKGKEE